jgi:hypothetical protein
MPGYLPVEVELPLRHGVVRARKAMKTSSLVNILSAHPTQLANMLEGLGAGNSLQVVGEAGAGMVEGSGARTMNQLSKGGMKRATDHLYQTTHPLTIVIVRCMEAIPHHTAAILHHTAAILHHTEVEAIPHHTEAEAILHNTEAIPRSMAAILRIMAVTEAIPHMGAIPCNRNIPICLCPRPTLVAWGLVKVQFPVGSAKTELS